MFLNVLSQVAEGAGVSHGKILTVLVFSIFHSID